MLLAVHKTVEIPFVITLKGETITFMPTAEVPDHFARAALKSSPHLYFDPEGRKIGINGYKLKDAFKGKTISDVVATLSDGDQLKVYEYAKSLSPLVPKFEQAGEDAPKKKVKE